MKQQFKRATRPRAAILPRNLVVTKVKPSAKVYSRKGKKGLTE